jgi:hypothetical protein
LSEEAFAIFKQNDDKLDSLPLKKINMYGTVDRGAVDRVGGVPGNVRDVMNKSILKAFESGKYLNKACSIWWHWYVYFNLCMGN